jgi:hypothetical protein
MNEIKEIFNMCDVMFINADIDYDELTSMDITEKFFEDYKNTRIVNSFLFNFSKLQDKIGAKLLKKTLYELKEIDSFSIGMIDVLNLLEKLEIVEDATDWDNLREIRNILAHEYPLDIDERVENIQLALDGYQNLKKIYNRLKAFINGN